MAALGPGAIVASLTIGTGELIFSTRAGALFGYRTLGLFALVLLLKWGLVLASARHWVYAEEHPLGAWTKLPGPRGWLPWTLLVVAVPAFPVWVSFHSGTLGTLLGAVTGTRESLGGNASLAWGIGILVLTLVVSVTGGYARQERFQAVVVALMLISVLVAVAMLKPDPMALFRGFLNFGSLEYPEWARELGEFRGRPVWVEAATYAGVVGGSGFDYLAYVAWLRDKHGVGAERQESARSLSRLVTVDATVSFVAVFLFSGVFVVCGAMLLGPRHQVPSGSDLLTLQAQIVSVVGPWLKPLYFAGAFLALGGTLYGTLEVAPAILREILAAVSPRGVPWEARRIRSWSLAWCGAGALLILAGSLVSRWVTGTQEAFNLVALVTPANLFTGVLACGWISGLNLWSNVRGHPRVPSLPMAIVLLNIAAAVLFCAVGVKAIWDQGRAWGIGVIGGCLVAGGIAAVLWNRSRGGRPPMSS